jgi:hypothetical protein
MTTKPAPKYERSGKAKPPQWWLDKVLPILASKEVRYADIARAASEHAGRRSPWRADAISKFRSGEIQTEELANGISAALQIPPPFFVAPTEAAAVAMLQIVKREQAYTGTQSEKLTVIDRVADAQVGAAIAARRGKRM